MQKGITYFCQIGHELGAPRRQLEKLQAQAVPAACCCAVDASRMILRLHMASSASAQASQIGIDLDSFKVCSSPHLPLQESIVNDL